LQDMPGALVEQPDDLGVELIDGFAMFRNNHGPARIHNPARLERAQNWHLWMIGPEKGKHGNKC
jgi:hypothetical protein